MSQDERRQARGVIKGLLALLSDRDEQRKYERDVAIANVPAELVCMWFDDHYHPSSAWFLDAFSDRERIELAAFSRFYEERLPRLPQDQGIEALHAAPEWLEIGERARLTLESIDAV